MREFTIANRTITQDSPPFVIAEIGNNHQGRVDLCKHLIHAAKRAGCDAVKLQKRHCRSLFTKRLYDSPYNNDNSFGGTYGLHKEALDFNESQWKEIIEFAENEEIFIFSTAFDFESVDFLAKLGIKAFKVASGDLKNIPLVQHIISYGLPTIISTGGGTWDDVDRVWRSVWDVTTVMPAPVCLLHCVASYPNRPEEMNMSIIPAMIERYPYTIIGFSDHYPGTLMSLMAYTQGARIFERHFTKDKSWRGPDHHLSSDPPEMEQMIHDMARIRAAYGIPEKILQACEENALYKMGKGLHFAHALLSRHVLTIDDITIKSPAEGLEPWRLDEVIGRTLLCPVLTDDPVTMEVLSE